MPHVKERRFGILLAMEAHGVPGVHGLNAAVQAGVHDMIGWYLERSVEPNGDTLVHAIQRGKKAIATILPHVKPNPDHIAVACLARRPDLLKHLLREMRVPATAKAFKNFFAREYLKEEAQQCIEELIRANETGRVGTMSLLYVMPMLTGSQLGCALDQAKGRFDLEKLYGHALQWGNAGAIAELRERTPLTAKVIERAIATIRRKDGHTYSTTFFKTKLNTVLREIRARGIPSLPTKKARGWCVRMLGEIARNASDELHTNATNARHPVTLDVKLSENLSLALALIEPAHREEVIQQLDAHVATLSSEEFRAYYPQTEVGLRARRDQIVREALETAVAATDAAAGYHTDAAPGL